MPPLSTAAQTGQLRFDATGECVGPGTRYSEFANTRTGKLLTKRTWRETVYAEVSRESLEGMELQISLEFENDQLVRVNLFVPQAGDSKGWDGWTKEGETARQRAGEAWIEKTFGQKPTLKPYISDTGKEIIPAMPVENHPRYLKFPWGEVVSYFDSKGGFPGVTVKYGK